MKKKVLNISEVTSISRQLCDLMEEKQHEVISIGVSLFDNGELKNYLTYLVCPVEDISHAIKSIELMNGKRIEDYFIPSEYCHITTFENNMHSRSLISFDENDDCPIKANINPEYLYVNAFFHRFLDYSEMFHGVTDYWDYLNNHHKTSSNKMLVRK